MKDLNKAILYYAHLYHGDWQKIGQAIKNKEPYQNLEIHEKYVTIVDENYPQIFKNLRYPPWILFYRGDLNLANEECIGIVGSRNCSQQALENTKTVVTILKKKYTIVSGLAKGIDGMAHYCSLDYKTIGILGCGINQVYPKENRKLYEKMQEQHLILSEYPSDTPPLRHHFPWRNRLIAALSKNLIVIEATFKSGTMITVNACLELGIPIYCLPTSFGQKDYLGCNRLIQNGANIIVDADDLEDM